MRPSSSLAAASLWLLACSLRAAPAIVPTKAPPPATSRGPTKIAEAPPAPEVKWDPDESCRSDGYDFVYKVEDEGGMLSAICGVGPGTPCQGESNRCDGANLLSCTYGKEGLTDCRQFCREIGDGNGIVYDGGGCITERNNSSCVCCDAGEPGCEHETPRPPSPTPESGVRLAKP